MKNLDYGVCPVCGVMIEFSSDDEDYEENYITLVANRWVHSDCYEKMIIEEDQIKRLNKIYETI